MKIEDLKLLWIALLFSCNISYLQDGMIINTWLNPTNIKPLYAENIILNDYGNLCILFKEDGETFLISEKKGALRDEWCFNEDNSIYSGGLSFNFNQVDQELWEVEITHIESSIVINGDVYICDDFDVLKINEEFERKKIDDISGDFRCF